MPWCPFFLFVMAPFLSPLKLTLGGKLHRKSPLDFRKLPASERVAAVSALEVVAQRCLVVFVAAAYVDLIFSGRRASCKPRPYYGSWKIHIFIPKGFDTTARVPNVKSSLLYSEGRSRKPINALEVMTIDLLVSLLQKLTSGRFQPPFGNGRV